MARKKKSARPHQRWAAADIKMMKAQAGKKPLEHIARALKRTPAAVRYKAHSLSLSLRRR